MSEFYPYFTADGSVGLYSKEFNDIFHSAAGALTESYDKFIYPSNIDYLLETKSDIKLLDICYGIGYNTKAFINYIFEAGKQKKFFYCKKFPPKNLFVQNNYAPIYTDKNIANQTEYIEEIHVDNTSRKNRQNIYNETIYSDKCLTNVTVNKCFKKDCTPEKHIYIRAVDYNKNLTLLSPFIKTGEKNFKRYKPDVPYTKIQKYLKNNENIPLLKIEEVVNFLLFEKIVQNCPEIFDNNEVISMLNNENLSPFFEKNMRGIFKLYQSRRSSGNPFGCIDTFLHNIYYHHVSDSYKRRLKTYSLYDINFDLKNDDARRILLEDNNSYNLIFLDAFMPSKCPCLWTYEFFKLLFAHLESDGMLLTYSSSASVRSAMAEAGFFIGEISGGDYEKSIGTVAVKNKLLIKFPLSNYESGLLKTKAGIFYRDEYLNASNDAILSARQKEVKLSNRISSTAYKNMSNSPK